MSGRSCGRRSCARRTAWAGHDTAAGGVAEAFCSHHFSEAYPHLADGVRWVLVGGATLIGRQEVIAACERTAQELCSVTTQSRKLRVIDTDVPISDITSYTVELAEPAVDE